ncbi:hypothetical protein LTR62_002659 [Meristemomyces frigidus]|uniref:Heme haloperoxidase family profile domain-containing protein n=1 Tax=Meristemomyces frigidus TaxID=1508187 RepID=A0AAN7TLR3_9PEZI|nr:hypothetical protein LTR62_002659 [Meristemomyces frigidus]
MLILSLTIATGVVSALPQFGGGFGGPGGNHDGPPFGGFGSSSPLPWSPPGPGDVRSPCPALNTLANHDLLPHSGKGITTEDIISAFAIGQNFAADTVTGAAAGALALCSSETGVNCTSWDLDMLDKPHAIEHDNSLSREDYNFGRDNNTVFSPQIWGQVLRVWHGAPIIDFNLANAARAERLAVSNATDAPGWFVPAVAAGYHETAFYLSLFGDPVEGNARQDWIDIWFQQERMPFEQGWTATQRETITAASLNTMVAKLQAL